ncbi:class A beta-lactamase-related serine hydrolase [Sphingobacterium psychroaquaticum]|uniref:serine hydrolase domain-containing protein n=1 Tax=Sphingobacterium psychroaquaticum TaxID=561061 RepID=UPI00106BF572|nr:serine hydrolase domain-containing protein [Sphingobacterium psychroaquaticum]QBQ42744.1 class A beta-lactamase-related serine hydrolase [Sphingobacterium psychroaquaticum]
MHYIMIAYLKQNSNKTIILLFLLFCSFAVQGQRDMYAKLQALSTKVGIPGMQVTFVDKGITTHYALGVKRMGAHETISRQTAFQAASLTKVVTAYVFLRLLDQGLISLDKPLWDYYPYDRLSQTPGKERITARMVLTHRSGLHNWEGDVPSPAWRATPLTLLFTPGTQYAYSGEGFYFLQETMEHITKKSFQQLVEEEVLTPLAMTHSEIIWKDRLLQDAAFGHLTGQKTRSLGQYRKANAAYTLYTTSEDYTKFVQRALLGGEGLKKETHQLLLTKQGEAQVGNTQTTRDTYVPCALGLRLQLNEVGTALWHTGSNPGFRCFFIAYPERKQSLAVFMNTEDGFQAMGDLLALFLNDEQTFWAYEWRQGELD